VEYATAEIHGISKIDRIGTWELLAEQMSDASRGRTA
jgi:hypothetical protein